MALAKKAALAFKVFVGVHLFRNVSNHSDGAGEGLEALFRVASSHDIESDAMARCLLCGVWCMCVLAKAKAMAAAISEAVAKAIAAIASVADRSLDSSF